LVRGAMNVNNSSLSDSSQWHRVNLDLRAQRVLRTEEDELHLIMNNLNTSFTVDVYAYIRVLVKLP